MLLVDREICVLPFVLKHELTLTLDHKGNVVTLERWFHLTAFTRILRQVDAGVGSSQWQGSLE